MAFPAYARVSTPCQRMLNKHPLLFGVCLAALCASLMWLCYGLFNAGNSTFRPSYPNRFAISPDGRSIVFSTPRTQGDLWELEPDNHKLVQVTNEHTYHGWPVFSPMGRMLVFSKQTTGGTGLNLYVTDSHGRGPKALTEGDYYDMGPAFSYDETRVFFFRANRRRAYSLGGETWTDWDLYVVNLDGHDIQRLTNEHYYIADPPHPTAKGEIIFAAMTNADEDQMTLYIFDRNSKPTVRRLEKGAETRDGGFVSAQPDVCPMKNEVVFISNRVSRQAPYDYELWTMNLTERKASKLTGLRSLVQYPTFDPMCDRILFYSDIHRDGTYDLCACNVDGSHVEKLYPGLCRITHRLP